MTATELFERFSRINVLIVGDVMIDRYINGEVNRISPEAPVPVVQWNSEEDRLGGAANVALNIRAMGATPFLCSVIGDDADGERFLGLLPGHGLSAMGIIQSGKRPTTVKTRVMAGKQQLLRIDRETVAPLDASEAGRLAEKALQLLDGGDIHVIIFQDYNKGVLFPDNIRALLAEAHKRGLPTAVDPKFHNFWEFSGVTLFKPNLKEVRAQVGIPVIAETTSLELAAAQVRKRLNNLNTMITLSEKGLFLDDGVHSRIIPTQPRAIADVSGAGDTVIAIVALGLAAGMDLDALGALANLAGGQVCEHLGVVPVNKGQLLREYELLPKT
jgi:rfaE bifunctional protein kinase chain/domain